MNQLRATISRENDAATTSQDASVTLVYTANFGDQRIVQRVTPSVRYFESSVPKHERSIGAIVAINGRVVAADRFGSTPLFRKI